MPADVLRASEEAAVAEARRREQLRETEARDLRAALTASRVSESERQQNALRDAGELEAALQESSAT